MDRGADYQIADVQFGYEWLVNQHYYLYKQWNNRLAGFQYDAAKAVERCI